MRLLFLALSITILFAGCNLRKPPTELDPDLVYDTIPLYDANKSSAPYDFPKFQAVLDGSKLQIGYDETVVDYGDFDGKKFPQFYADSDENLHFVISKEAEKQKVRSELHEGPNSWSTADTEGHFWVATLKCLKPKPGITSYTWMQIHGTNDTYNYPLLRLFWVRQRESIYDHIWAIIMVSDPDSEKIYEYRDLGERPKDFFTAEVHIKNNIMDILINRQLKTTVNVGYWEDVQNYFKAGVYIDRTLDGGAVSAIFSDLHFYDDSSKVVLVHH
jgi:hypothetical protein